MAVRVKSPVLPIPKPVHQQTPEEALVNLRYLEKHISDCVKELERHADVSKTIAEELADQRAALLITRSIIAKIEEDQGGRVLH